MSSGRGPAERDARTYVPDGDFTDLAGLVDVAEALAVARDHRGGWLRGYRDVLGFVTLVLRRVHGGGR